MDFSGLEIAGNIWDPFRTQLNEIYHKELSFLVILVPELKIWTPKAAKNVCCGKFGVDSS